MKTLHSKYLPGADCWLEGPAPAAAPEVEAIAIMLCIISGDMLDIIELTLFIISGETLMPAASRDPSVPDQLRCTSC